MAAAPQVQIDQLVDVHESRVAKSRSLKKEMENLDNPNKIYLKCSKLLNLTGLSQVCPRLVIMGTLNSGKDIILDMLLGISLTDFAQHKRRRPVVLNVHAIQDGKNTIKMGDVSIENADKFRQAYMHAACDSTVKNPAVFDLDLKDCANCTVLDLPECSPEGKTPESAAIWREHFVQSPNDLVVFVQKASEDLAVNKSFLNFLLGPAPKGLNLSFKNFILVCTNLGEIAQKKKDETKTVIEFIEQTDEQKNVFLSDAHMNIPIFYISIPTVREDEITNMSAIDISKLLTKKAQSRHLEMLKKITDVYTSSEQDLKIVPRLTIVKLKAEVTRKLQDILHIGLCNMEKRIFLQQSLLEREKAELEIKSLSSSPMSTREAVGLYIREYCQIIMDILSGDFAVLQQEEGADEFLNRWGGTIVDNLIEGHEYGLKKIKNYDPHTLDDIFKALQSDRGDIKVAEEKQLNAGTRVRFSMSKEKSYLYGIVNSKPAQTGVTHIETNFFYVTEKSTTPQSISKDVLRDKLHTMMALKKIPMKTEGKLRTWRRIQRPDHWYGLEPVECIIPPPGADGAPATEFKVHKLRTNEINAQVDNTDTHVVPIADLFVDVETEEDIRSVRKYLSFGTGINEIVGSIGSAKALNQTSLIALGRWLKYFLFKHKAGACVDPSALLQMCRSVVSVVDKNNWEPVVCDMLQLNVKSTIISAVKLICCAASVALRRVFTASLEAVNRQIPVGDSASLLKYLVENDVFYHAIGDCIETHCQKTAESAIATMTETLLEITHVLDFESTLDIFSNCRVFETIFFPDLHVMEKIEKKLAADYRKQKIKLSSADVHDRVSDTEKIPLKAIYHEVEKQFWAARMLLAAPLTTKLYNTFVQDVWGKDYRTQSGSRAGSFRIPLEAHIVKHVLYDQDSGLALTAKELEDKYNLSTVIQESAERLEAAKRAIEYLDIATKVLAITRRRIRLKIKDVNILPALNMI